VSRQKFWRQIRLPRKAGEANLPDKTYGQELRAIEKPVSLVRITNTASGELPISFEPWAFTRVVPSSQWIDAVVIGHKSIALDVHFRADEAIAYTETGTILKLFDHSGESIETGWDETAFPDPADYT
jgi:hypothetical protein